MAENKRKKGSIRALSYLAGMVGAAALIVIRWEYRPSSVLYLVWSQGRTGYDRIGQFAFGEGFRGLFDIHPGNVFLVKFSYCFTL